MPIVIKPYRHLVNSADEFPYIEPVFLDSRVQELERTIYIDTVYHQLHIDCEDFREDNNEVLCSNIYNCQERECAFYGHVQLSLKELWKLHAGS